MTGDDHVRASAWRARGAIGAFSILVVGFLLGMIADRFLVAHEGARPEIHGIAVTSMHDEAIASFRDVLDLDDAQLTRIHEILTHSQRDVDSAWTELRAGIHATIQGVHAEIEEVLTEEQMVLFREWVQGQVLTGPSGDPVFRWDH